MKNYFAIFNKIFRSDESLYNMGMMHYEGKGVQRDYLEAFKLFQISAVKGNANAQHYLGLLYTSGFYGVKRDFAKAAMWFTKSAKQDHVGSCLYMGDSYYYGRGVEKDFEKAKKWYSKAIRKDQDNWYSERMLAFIEKRSVSKFVV